MSTYSIVQIFKNEFIKLEDDLRLYMCKRGTKGMEIIDRTYCSIDIQWWTKSCPHASYKFS